MCIWKTLNRKDLLLPNRKRYPLAGATVDQSQENEQKALEELDFHALIYHKGHEHQQTELLSTQNP